jgi:hypothetical protein
MNSTNSVTLTETLREHYAKVFQDGHLVSVHVSKWGMDTNLKKEDLETNKTLPKIYKLGKKMLIAEERLNEFMSIEGKARRFLYKNSFDFPVGEAHFVPRKAIPNVLLVLDKYQTEYTKLADMFIAKFGEYKKEMMNKYPELKDSMYPKVETLRDRFHFSISMYELAMPKELAEVDLKELISRERAEEEVKAQLKKQLEGQYINSMHQLEKFTEEAAKALRVQMVTLCSSLIEKINNKEIISKSKINMIRQEIDNFKVMNFLDDKVVAGEIEKLEKVLEGRHNFRSDQEAIDSLNNALSSVVEKAQNITDIATIRGSYFRAIKV